MKAARTAEPQFCAAELVAVAEYVPQLGIRGTARKLDRDPKAVWKWACRIGAKSRFGQRGKLQGDAA